MLSRWSIVLLLPRIFLWIAASQPRHVTLFVSSTPPPEQVWSVLNASLTGTDIVRRLGRPKNLHGAAAVAAAARQRAAPPKRKSNSKNGVSTGAELLAVLNLARDRPNDPLPFAEERRAAHLRLVSALRSPDGDAVAAELIHAPCITTRCRGADLDQMIPTIHLAPRHSAERLY